MATMLGIERWYPMGSASPGSEVDAPLGNPFAATVPDIGGPTGPDQPDVDNYQEKWLGVETGEDCWINHATGNLVVRVALPHAGGLSHDLVLTYNLQNTGSDNVGPQWTLNTSEFLSESATLVTLTKGDGRQRVYTVSGAATLPPSGVYNNLTKRPDGKWVEIQRNGEWRYFNGSYLDHIVDRFGNVTSYSRYQSGASFVGMTDPAGRRFTFTQNLTLSYISAIQDPAGRFNTLGYDGLSRLSSLQRPDGARLTFSYEGSTNHLKALQDPDGFITTFTLGTFNSQPAVMAVQDPKGAIKSLSYNASSGACVVQDPLNHTWTSICDSLGRLVSFSDPLARVSTFAWDSNNQVSGVSILPDKVSSFAYNSYGRMTSETDPQGNRVGYGYLPDGKWLATVTDQTGKVTSLAYYDVLLTDDPALYNSSRPYNSNMPYDGPLYSRQALIDSLGNPVTYSYNNAGQVATSFQVIDGHNSTVSYDYYGPGESSPQFMLKRRGLSLDAAGHYAYTDFSYDLAGNLTQVIDADSKSMSYVYSPMDRLQAEVDSLGRRTSYGYDNRGNPIVSMDPMGNRVTSVYDGVSQLISQLDPLLNRVTFGYDLAGNHNLYVDAEGAQTQYGYSPGRDMVSRTDPVDGQTLYTPDVYGRVNYAIDPMNRMASYGYDLLDQLSKAIEYPSPSAPQSSSYAYTPRGELQQETDPTAIQTSYAYRDNGPLQNVMNLGLNGQAMTTHAYTSHLAPKSYQDPRGNLSTHSYDESGRRYCTQDALGRRTTLLYTPAGDLQTTMNARGAITTLVYDLLHRPVARQVWPGTGPVQVSTTVYDDAGRVSQEIYPDGASLTYGYFNNGWLQVQVDPMGFRSSYTYNKRGQRQTVTDAEGRVTTLGYDLQGRQIFTIDPLGLITTLSYDSSGNHIFTEDPLGHIVTYVYDGANRLIEEHVSPQGGVELVTAYGYDGAGRRVLITFPDSTTYGYTWVYPRAAGYREERDELQRVRTFTWDNLGNAVSEIDPNGNRAYVNYYDALNRVYYTQGQRAYALGAGQATQSFVYDEVSNRTAIIDALGHRSTTLYDLLNRPTTFARSTGSVLLTQSQDYNLRGSRSYFQDARGHRSTFLYDLDQRMSAMQDPLGAYTSYAYLRHEVA